MMRHTGMHDAAHPCVRSTAAFAAAPGPDADADSDSDPVDSDSGPVGGIEQSKDKAVVKLARSGTRVLLS